MTRLAALALLALAACSDSNKLVTHDEVVDIADDAVDASELPGRMDDLEAEVERLDAENQDLRSRVETLEINSY